jgi:hypothetical protein
MAGLVSWAPNLHMTVTKPRLALNRRLIVSYPAAIPLAPRPEVFFPSGCGPCTYESGR